MAPKLAYPRARHNHRADGLSMGARSSASRMAELTVPHLCSSSKWDCRMRDCHIIVAG